VATQPGPSRRKFGVATCLDAGRPGTRCVPAIFGTTCRLYRCYPVIMKLGWVYHERYLEHDTGKFHPERPDRLRAIVKHFRETKLADELTPIEASPADVKAIERIHDPMYVASVKAACENRTRQLDGDTTVCPASYDVALLASGGVLNACEQVLAGDFKRAFCTVRPPGHHAEHDKAMGFCLFNNIAVAAHHCTREDGIERVAVVDFDVHHGNGTQHTFEERADVLFISIHQDPRTLYPGTGFAHETGRGKGDGFTLNVPMTAGDGDAAYRAAFEKLIIPKLYDYRPQVLLISAGFDAAKEDPLAQIELTPDGFTMMTQQLVTVANEHCDGRIVSVLEGGYDLGALARCAEAHARALMEEAP